MSYSNNSALRNATARASLDFYDELAQKTLLIIKRLKDYSNQQPVTVERIKQELGINYNVLNRVLSDLSNQGALEFYVVPEKINDYSTSDMQVEMTSAGEAMARRSYNLLQRKANIL